jgi:hypothetical protein
MDELVLSTPAGFLKRITWNYFERYVSQREGVDFDNISEAI